MSRPSSAFFVILMSGLLALGCSSLGLTLPGAESAEGPSLAATMDQERMERIFSAQVEKITGGQGFIRSKFDGFDIFVVSDVENDRMQMMVRIGAAERIDERYLTAMLEANVQSTLDARYGVTEGIIYSLFLHRISTLKEEDLISAFNQTVNLARNFGTTFSSRESIHDGDGR